MLKKLISVVLCVTMLLCVPCLNVSAVEMTYDEWEEYWANGGEISNAQMMSPGSNESERNFSWYSPLDAGKCSVKISLDPEMKTDVRSFPGTWVNTLQGDRSNKVTVTGLNPGTTYYYTCCTDLGETAVRSFKTDSGNDFSAVYLTDIHISEESKRGTDTKGGVSRVKEQSHHLGQTLGAALERNPDISLLLSAGDQGSNGYREEYEGLVAPKETFGISVAPTLGNHDRKNIDYRFFTNNPNEDTNAFLKSYAGGDYWFVKGDVLFLDFDSNCGSMTNHYRFIKNALKANPDVKWRVAMMHHDLYGDRKPSRESETKLMRMLWTPVFDEFGFDLVLMGHSHYYTVSDVIYDNKVTGKTGQNGAVTDPCGTVYMVSGSVNRPASYAENVPVGDKIGFAYLPEEKVTVYNILDFSESSIKISSYTVEKGECFNTLTITKTSQKGGHPDDHGDWYGGIVRFIGAVFTFFDNIGVYNNVKNNGVDISFFKMWFGR